MDLACASVGRRRYYDDFSAKVMPSGSISQKCNQIRWSLFSLDLHLVDALVKIYSFPWLWCPLVVVEHYDATAYCFHKVSQFRLFLTVILLKKDTIQSYLRYFDRSASPQAFASSFSLLLPSPNVQATSPHPALPLSPIPSYPIRQWIPCIKSFTSTSDTKSQSTVAIRTESQAGDCLSVSNYLRGAAAGSRASDSCSLEVSTKHREPHTHTRTHARPNDTDSITLKLAFSTGRAFYISSDGVPVFSLLFVSH